MKYLNKITDQALQKVFIPNIEGKTATLQFRFLPTQNKWIMDVLYDGREINGIAVLCSANILRNYRNLIPFGFLCKTPDGLDPFFIDDFSSQRARLYLLSADEVAQIETDLFT